MSEFYDEAAAVVTEALAEYGAPLTIRKIVAGEYDTDTGGMSQTITDHVTVGLRESYRLQDIDGSTIKRNDVKLLIGPALTAGGQTPAPTTQDKIIFDGSTYTVQNVDPWNYAGVSVGFSVQARK
ncbi:MAG: hypothetical protein K2X80_07260 [Pseudomonadaceae bacterium]|nr:hypothetical protein [Pseudomonadaceae bacterium]